MSSLSGLVSDLRSKFNTEAALMDVCFKFRIWLLTKWLIKIILKFVSFFENSNRTGNAREVKVSTEKIKANILWLNTNYQPIKEWLYNSENSSKYFY